MLLSVQRVNAERDAAIAERAYARKLAEADAKAVIDEQVKQHKEDKAARKAYVHMRMQSRPQLLL